MSNCALFSGETCQLTLSELEGEAQVIFNILAIPWSWSSGDEEGAEGEGKEIFACHPSSEICWLSGFHFGPHFGHLCLILEIHFSPTLPFCLAFVYFLSSFFMFPPINLLRRNLNWPTKTKACQYYGLKWNPKRTTKGPKWALKRDKMTYKRPKGPS